MSRKAFKICCAVILTAVFALGISGIAFAAEESEFFDDFDTIDTERWTAKDSGDGKVKLEEHDGRSVLSLFKGSATSGSEPSVTLKENVGHTYTATAVVKIEQAEGDATIKSFEYVYFNLTTGTDVYRLQWFYNSSELVLQKNGVAVRKKNYTKLAGYQKYGWNEYKFEVTENWIKILVNGREIIYHTDDSLSSENFKFGISALTMWPKNVGVYVDSVCLSPAPDNAVMIDPDYSVRLTTEGKIRISSKVYAPSENTTDKAVLIGALYEGNTLKGVASTEFTLPSGARSSEFALEFEATDLFKELQVKIMLWKDMGAVIPIDEVLVGTSGYFIEDFDTLPETEQVYDVDFDDGIQDLDVMPNAYEAGGHRVEKIQGNNVLKIFSGYAKSGTQRSYGVLLPDEYGSYVMDVTLRSRRYLSESASIILNYRDPEDYYAVTWTQEGFPNLWEKRPAQKFRLCRNSETDILSENSWNFEEIMDDDAPFISQSYRIFVFDNRILVYRKPDGTPIFDYKSDTPIESGQIGFGVNGKGSGNMEFYVDDLKVWRLDISSTDPEMGGYLS